MAEFASVYQMLVAEKSTNNAIRAGSILTVHIHLPRM
jgi:hypothetical protein